MPSTGRKCFMWAGLLCVLAAAVAGAAEGMGPHRGSVVFFPYWTVERPFLTVWRVVNAPEIDDPRPEPVIPDENDPAYDQNPLHLRVSFLRTPDCQVGTQSFAFSPDDYRLIVVNRLQGVSGSGWAWGRAVMRGAGPAAPAVWNRFYSDTIVVNTSEGWARGWSNYQHVLSTGPVRQTPLVAPSSFYAHYFTSDFRYSGGRAADTEFSITPIEIFEPSIFEPGEQAWFTGGGSPADFDYDAILYDADERPVSVPAGRVVCQEVLTIRQLTSGQVRGIPQGWVHFWALDPPGEPDPNGDGLPFNPAGGDDWDGAGVLSWDLFRSGRSAMAWGSWTTHDKTSVDDRDILPPPAEDFDPEAP